MLVIKKVRDAMVIPPFIALCKWFINQKRMVVFVESAIMGDPVLTRNPEFGHIQDKLMTFNETKDDLTDKIDFCVCLGGDGTLLYASSLFQQSVRISHITVVYVLKCSWLFSALCNLCDFFPVMQIIVFHLYFCTSVFLYFVINFQFF